MTSIHFITIVSEPDIYQAITCEECREYYCALDYIECSTSHCFKVTCSLQNTKSSAHGNEEGDRNDKAHSNKKSDSQGI